VGQNTENLFGSLRSICVLWQLALQRWLVLDRTIILRRRGSIYMGSSGSD